MIYATTIKDKKKAWRYALSIKKKVKDIKRKNDIAKASEILPFYLDACEVLKENTNERADYHNMLCDMAKQSEDD
jgi:intergrase/recombinase